MATGEQQSEAGHDVKYSNGSTTGSYRGEFYRDAQAGGYIQYTLENPKGEVDGIALMCRFTTADAGRKATLYIDGEKLADVVIAANQTKTDENGFYNVEYPLTREMLTDTDGGVLYARFKKMR